MCRKGTRFRPLQVRQRPHSLALPSYSRAAIHYPLLVRHRAHVLAAAWLVSLLRRVDHLVPACSPGERQYRIVAARLRRHCHAAERHPDLHLQARFGLTAAGNACQDSYRREEQGNEYYGREEDFIDGARGSLIIENNPTPHVDSILRKRKRKNKEIVWKNVSRRILTQSSSLQTLRLCNTTEKRVYIGIILTLATTEKRGSLKLRMCHQRRREKKIHESHEARGTRSVKRKGGNMYISLMKILLLAVIVLITSRIKRTQNAETNLQRREEAIEGDGGSKELGKRKKNSRFIDKSWRGSGNS